MQNKESSGQREISGRKSGGQKIRLTKTRAVLTVLVSSVLLWGCSGSIELPGQIRQQSGLEETGQQAADPVMKRSEDPEDSTEYQQETPGQEELDLRYYYSLLDEESRQIYRELVQGIRDGQEVIVTHGNDPETVNDICTRVFMDYPEFFWCSGTVETISYTGVSSYCEVRPEYTCTSEEREIRRQQIENAANQCLSGLPTDDSTYEKIRYLYTWLIEQTEYAADSTDNQNIYSVLVNRRSVCAGYSRTFQYLANRAGIFNIYVTGTVNQGQSHAWNIVSCDGAYYNVDVTFGDPVFIQSEAIESENGAGQNRTYYDYLCVSDREFYRNHTPDASLNLPSCTSDALEYYRMTGRYFEQVSESEMLALMRQDIEYRNSWSDFKYSSEETFQQATAILPQVMDEAAAYLCSYYNLSRTTYQYSQDPETLRISVYWSYT